MGELNQLRIQHPPRGEAVVIREIPLLYFIFQFPGVRAVTLRAPGCYLLIKPFSNGVCVLPHFNTTHSNSTLAVSYRTLLVCVLQCAALFVYLCVYLCMCACMCACQVCICVCVCVCV